VPDAVAHISPPPRRHTGAYASLLRITAMVVRNLYLMRRSLPRLIDLFYWPTVQMVLWGLMGQFMAGQSDWVARAAGIFIAGVLLWDTLARAQVGLGFTFLEEVWSRNLAQLFVSPLRPGEMVTVLVIMASIRTLIGLLPPALLAIVLFHYNIFSLGWALPLFFANLLIMGWAIGLAVAGLILRYGVSVESLTWMAVFVLAPLSGPYFPIDTLPAPIRIISWGLPSAHIFEGMRQVMFEHTMPWHHLVWASALNVIYMAVGIAIFLRFFHLARLRGGLMQTGE
jgi:ABC-2 type transport system permease protein